jgi:hypothetical protein
MSDEQGGAPIKKKLLGWVQGALGKLENALDEKAAAPQPQQPPARPGAAPGSGALGKPATGGLNRPAAPGSGPLKGASGPLGGQALPGQRAASTGGLARGSDNLVRSTPPAAGPASGPLMPPAPPQKDPEEAAAESKQRMGFIIAYMNDPEGDPLFKDKQLVYKILTEERSDQQNLIVRLSEEAKALAPGDPQAIELEAQIGNARTRQGQLFTLLKRLTGIRGKTGGTGFIAKAADTPPPFPGEQDASGKEGTEG